MTIGGNWELLSGRAAHPGGGQRKSQQRNVGKRSVSRCVEEKTKTKNEQEGDFFFRFEERAWHMAGPLGRCICIM